MMGGAAGHSIKREHIGGMLMRGMLVRGMLVRGMLVRGMLVSGGMSGRLVSGGTEYAEGEAGDDGGLFEDVHSGSSCICV